MAFLWILYLVFASALFFSLNQIRAFRKLPRFVRIVCAFIIAVALGTVNPSSSHLHPLHGADCLAPGLLFDDLQLAYSLVMTTATKIVAIAADKASAYAAQTVADSQTVKTLHSLNTLRSVVAGGGGGGADGGATGVGVQEMVNRMFDRMEGTVNSESIEKGRNAAKSIADVVNAASKAYQYAEGGIRRRKAATTAAAADAPAAHSSGEQSLEQQRSSEHTKHKRLRHHHTNTNSNKPASSHTAHAQPHPPRPQEPKYHRNPRTGKLVRRRPAGQRPPTTTDEDGARDVQGRAPIPTPPVGREPPPTENKTNTDL